MPKVYRITSKRDGFRRAGLSHPATAVDHAADSLTAEQLAILRIEPNLVVQELELPDEPKPPLALDGGGEPKPPEQDEGDDDKGGKAGKAKTESK